jgi:hypothetical protein
VKEHSRYFKHTHANQKVPLVFGQNWDEIERVKKTTKLLIATCPMY